MTFEIKPVDPQLFESIWTPNVANQIDKYIYCTANWSDDLSGSRWAIDEAKGAFLLWVHMANRMDGASCYALVMNDEYALIRTEGYCKYSITATSSGMATQLETVKAMVTEALRLGGESLDSNNTFPVPEVKFVASAKPKGE